MPALPDTRWTPAAELAPGDQYIHQDRGRAVTVEITGAATPLPPEREFFGRSGFIRLPARRLDTGASGHVEFGPGGRVAKLTATR